MTTEQRVAIYARVSSEQQAEAGTIHSQLEALKQRVQQDGFELEEELCFLDDGYSGATLLRPALERLRDVAASGALDRVYVHSPDRLSRKYAYQVLLLDELQRCGVEVTFLNHELGRTPEEDLLLQVQGMVAEYERAKIIERSRRGKRHAARMGTVSVLSSAPYGYRYIASSDGDGSAEFSVVLEEAHIVRKIFEWIGRDRLTIGAVRQRLKDQATPSPRGKALWDRTTIWGILKNPVYKGTAAFGKTRNGPRRASLRPLRGSKDQPRRPYSVYDVPSEDWILIPVPALVSEDLFATVQEQLAENRKVARERRRGAAYLLQGLVVCRRCGYAFYGKSASSASSKGKRRRYAYYRCIGSDAHRFEGKRICGNRQVRTDLLEDAVWADVQAILQDPGRIETEFARRLRKDTGVGEDNLDQIRARINKVKRGIARLIDAYSEGLLDKSEFEPRVKKSKHRLECLETEFQDAEQKQNEQKELTLLLSRIEDFAEQVRDGLQVADWSARREIIRSLVKRVEVDEDNVQVVYRIDPHPFVEAPSGGIWQDCWRRDHSTLGCAPLRVSQLPVLEYPGLEPLIDHPSQYTVTHPLVQDFPQLAVVQVVEVRLNVHVQHPAAAHLHDALAQRAQRVMCRALGSKPVRAVQKVLLVHRSQHHRHRPLQHFVRKSGDAQRPGLLAIAFRYVYTPHRGRSIASGLEPLEKLSQVVVQVGREVFGTLAVDSRRAALARQPVRLAEKLHVDVVRQAGKDSHWVLLRQLRYPPQFR